MCESVPGDDQYHELQQSLQTLLGRRNTRMMNMDVVLYGCFGSSAGLLGPYQGEG